MMSPCMAARGMLRPYRMSTSKRQKASCLHECRVHGLLVSKQTPTAWRAFIFPAFSWMVIALDTTFFSASMASASAWMAVLSVCAWPSEAPMWFCRSKASNLVCCATAWRSSSCGEPLNSVDYRLPPQEQHSKKPWTGHNRPT